MLLKEQIKEVYQYQRDYYSRLPDGIPRSMTDSIDMKGSHVQIISGIRRCGKSTLLRQLAAKSGSHSFLSFEDPRLAQFEVKDFFKLETIFQESDASGVFFLDEIQQVAGWEQFIRVVHDKGTRVALSGSNASMLSGELGTSLTGRQITHTLFPFSYPEYLAFTNGFPGTDSFLKYLESGGFPEYLASGDPNVLISLYHDLIYRDIIVRHGLRNPRVVRELGVYLASNMSKKASFSSLSRTFGLGSVNTAQSYLSYFEDAFLFFAVPFFSYSVKQQAKHPKKIYGVDTGLVRALSLSFSKDIGRLLENMVFIELLRRNKEVYYFRAKHECDFISVVNRKMDQPIQVCYHLTSDNIDRELAGLMEAMDALTLKSGLILTNDQEDRLEKEQKTVDVMPVWKWILSYNANLQNKSGDSSGLGLVL